jgi:hypothetical protein
MAADVHRDAGSLNLSCDQAPETPGLQPPREDDITCLGDGSQANAGPCVASPGHPAASSHDAWPKLSFQ